MEALARAAIISPFQSARTFSSLNGLGRLSLERRRMRLTADTASYSSPGEVTKEEQFSRVKWSMLLQLYSVPASVKFPDSVTFQYPTACLNSEGVSMRDISSRLHV